MKLKHWLTFVGVGWGAGGIEGAQSFVPELTLRPIAVRELEADRPDATESPVTVDRGRFQLESSFFSYRRDRRRATTTEIWAVGESNIKYGLRDGTDLQLLFTPYVRARERTAETTTILEDFGDVVVRLKYNLWGNDGGETAMAVLPFVKVPARTKVSNGRWEGGLVVPFAWRGGDRWGLGTQVEADRVFDDDENEFEWDFSHTIVLGVEVTERLGAYLEYLGIAGGHPYWPFLSAGVTCNVTDFVRLDAGAVVGLAEGAEDLKVFTGMTVKF